jgi:hypothetical protein
MPTNSTFGSRLATSLLLLGLAGCSDATTPVSTLPRKAVSGTVTFDGQPLAQGKIQFDPVEGSPSGSTFAVGDITDGKYFIDRAMGPVPGKYKVSISSRPSIKIGPNDEPGTKPKQEPEKIPAQFNSQTTLIKEITTDNQNTIDYELKSS